MEDHICEAPQSAAHNHSAEMSLFVESQSEAELGSTNDVRVEEEVSEGLVHHMAMVGGREAAWVAEAAGRTAMVEERPESKEVRSCEMLEPMEVVVDDRLGVVIALCQARAAAADPQKAKTVIENHLVS